MVARHASVHLCRCCAQQSDPLQLCTALQQAVCAVLCHRICEYLPHHSAFHGRHALRLQHATLVTAVLRGRLQTCCHCASACGPHRCAGMLACMRYTAKVQDKSFTVCAISRGPNANTARSAAALHDHQLHTCLRGACRADGQRITSKSASWLPETSTQASSLMLGGSLKCRLPGSLEVRRMPGLRRGSYAGGFSCSYQML
jgi:hypothetical protein